MTNRPKDVPPFAGGQSRTTADVIETGEWLLLLMVAAIGGAAGVVAGALL